MTPECAALLEAATRPYRAAGRYAWHFARGKLTHDPVFLFLLSRGLLPDEGTLVDAGCGQGLLLSLLRAAKDQYAAGRWPRGWPPPPRRLLLSGVDSHAGRIRLARGALGASARVEACDVRDFAFQPPCSAVVLLDVLLYLEEAQQDRVIDGAAAALAAGGVLILREADAAGGFAFQMTKWSAWFDAAVRGSFGTRLHCRARARWQEALARRGLSVDAHGMSEGTPFANVLFVARKLV